MLTMIIKEMNGLQYLTLPMDLQYSVSYHHSSLADSVVDTAAESSVVDFQTL